MEGREGDEGREDKLFMKAIEGHEAHEGAGHVAWRRANGDVRGR